MSALYKFLTEDPEPRHGGILGCESMEAYHARRIRRLKLQRLLIRSFPREFQALDEQVTRERMSGVGGENKKEGLIAAFIGTFTGRDTFVGAMITPIRERLRSTAPEAPKDELKALRWVKGGRWAELDRRL